MSLTTELDKLIVTCKQLYDFRISEQRREIEQLRAKVKRLEEFRAEVSKDFILFHKVSDLEASFTIPEDMYKYWKTKLGISPLISLEILALNFAINLDKEAFLSYDEEEHTVLWNFSLVDVNGSNPHVWRFPTKHAKETCGLILDKMYKIWKDKGTSTLVY